MHFAYAHLGEQIRRHGKPIMGDDSGLEKGNKLAKKFKKITMPVSATQGRVLKKQRRFKMFRGQLTEYTTRGHAMPPVLAEQMLRLQGARANRRAMRAPAKRSAKVTQTLVCKREIKAERKKRAVADLDSYV